MKSIYNNMTKRITVFLVIIMLVVSLVPSVPNYAVTTEKAAYEDVSEIELNYYFGNLQIGEGKNGKSIDIEGLTKVNDVGMPNLPSKSISILIPSGKQVTKVNVLTSDIENYDNILVEPAADIVSSAELIVDNASVEYDQKVYQGNDKYPVSQVSEGSASTTRGYQIYNMLLYPVTYQNKGLSFAKHMKIVVSLADEDIKISAQARKDSKIFVPTKEDESFIENKVENIDAAMSYYNKIEGTSGSSILLGSDQYDYIVITAENLKPAFENLVAHKITRGIKAKTVTTAEIYSSYSGRDTAEQIRNFIIDAYRTNHIKYVLLGGDADGTNPVVPTRILYCEPVTTDTTTSIASDLYFGCLDGDYDANRNSIFGEMADSVDFTYDVLVGRAPVDDLTEATNFVTKTITYEQRQQSAKVTFVGEVLQSNSDGCTSELAADIQSTMDADTLTDNLRTVRDQIVDAEYVAIYYDSNDLLKSVFVNDMTLLVEFSGILVDYYSSLSTLVRTGDCDSKITKKDVQTLTSFCKKLKKAIASSSYSYDKKEQLLDELEYMRAYIGMSEGKSFGEVVLNSKYIDPNKTSRTVEYKSIDGEDDKENYIFGGDYMDEIKDGAITKNGSNDFETVGFPDNYNKSTLYDRDYEKYNWPKSEVISVMNSSPEVINHLGHCNNTTLMKCDVSDIEALTNKEAFFLYTQGCYAGSFDNMDTKDAYSAPDCIAEQLVVSNSVSGAYACIVNSRYGWYSRVGTDGPSQAYNRKFWDAVFTTNESSRNIGSMLALSKEYFIEYLTGYSTSTAMLFCYYEQNLLGDPETSLYLIANPVQVPATSVEVNIGKNIKLEKGKNITATAFLYPKNNTDKVYWKTSNKKIATVDDKGTITGKKAGTAKITAKALGGKTYVTTVTVINAEKSSKATKSITLSQAEASLLRGETFTLKASIKGSGTGMLWYSSDINVATVSNKGVVTIVGAGQCNIYCRTANGKSAVCKVTGILPPLNDDGIQ